MLLIFYLLIENIFAQIGSLELYPSINTIQASTTYELKFLLQQTMPINSIITIDFSNTDIIVTDGTLSKCTGSIYFTSISTDYSDCQCTSKICKIIVSSSVPNASLYLLKFGLLTNPSFVKPQNVGLTIDFLTIKKTQQYTVDVYQAGALTQISLLQSSYKVYDSNNIKLTLQSQHSIVSQGQIIITFPTQILFSQLNTNVEINSQNYTGTVTISGQSVTVTNIFSTQLNAGSQFIIYLLNIQNQESVRTSNSITIQTATQYAYLIDSIGFQIQTKTPENINIQYLNTQDTQIVNQIATYQFTLQPALKFTNGGYLEIKFPTDLTIQTNMSCQRIIGLTLVSGTIYSCTYSGQYIRTNNLQYPNSANSMILTVSNIKNPFSTKPTDTFEFRTYDSDGYLMCVSSSEAKFTASPDILSATITRSTTTVAMQSIYTIVLTNKNSIPQNGFINLKLGTQAYKQTIQSLQCLDQANNLLQCQYDTNNQQIKITLSQTVNANTQQTIILQYLQNPNYIITSTSDFEIDTCDTKNYNIDQLLNVPITPQLTPNSIQSIVYYRNNDKSSSQSTLDIGSITQVEIQFQITSQFIAQNDGNAVIDLNGYYYLNTDETITCNQMVSNSPISKNCVIQSYFVEDDPKIYYLSKISIPNIIQNSNTNIDIIITGLRSELIAGTYSHTISVSIYTLSNQLVSTGYSELGNIVIINNEVQLTQLSITSDSLITGQNAQYTIKHTLKYPIDIKSRNSYLQLVLPNEIGIDSLSSCLITLTTYTLECKISSNQIQIFSTINPYELNQDVTIILSQIRNPYSTALTSKFLLQYFYNGIKSVTTSSTYQVNQPNQLSVLINRTNQLINQQSQFTFTMTLNNQVSNLIYSILLPTDQFIQNQMVVKINDVQQAILTDSSNSGYLSIKFKENGCPCSISTQLAFTISGFQNPLISSNSVAQIQLLDDQNNIYQENKAIQIPGVQSGRITISSITQTAQNLDDTTIISISITNDTPYENSIITILFNPDNLPFQQSNIQVKINNNLSVCTIDQLKYSISCSNISIKQTNLIQLSNINSIKWLKKTNNCQLQLYSYYGTTLLDQSTQANCNNLVSLNTKSFVSSITRNNRILNQNTDLNIKFTNEIQQYLTLKLPLSEVSNDPSFSCDFTSITKSQISKDSNYLIFQLQFGATNNNIFDFNFLQLQNANQVPTSQQNYIIELSNDGSTVSYTSQNTITPELMCQGSQCSDKQLTISSFIKSTNLISTRCDVNINLALPVSLKDILTLQLTMSQTTIDSQTICYLNNTLINCQKLLRDSCTMCEQTQVNFQLKNAINVDQFNSLEKVCVSLETQIEESQICSNIEQKYDYLLDVKNIAWKNNTYFNQDGRLSFQIQFASPLNNKYQNLLVFQLADTQVDFTNGKAYMNDNAITFSLKDSTVSLQICNQNCDVNILYDLEIFQIKFNQYVYSASQLTVFQVQRGDQLLEQSNQISIYPKSLSLNQLLVTAYAENFVQLHYSLQSQVIFQDGSQIKFKFQNDNCVQQVAIGSEFNSTCSLKNNFITQVTIIFNNIITHQSNQLISITITNQSCPTPYYNYQDNCYAKCPQNAYDLDYICYTCQEENCASCNQSECLKCSTNYDLIDSKCQMRCLINDCQQCSLENNIQNCLTCVTPYQLYQNKCKLKNDCQIENCSICEISNQTLSCVECATDLFKFGNSCQHECPDGYFSNLESRTCNICSNGCQICTQIDICTNCQKQYTLKDSKCVCNINNCEKCQSTDKCDKCQEQYPIYYLNSCMNSCPVGYYEENKSCFQCNSQCKTCNINQCLTCSNGYYLENFKCVLKQCPINCQNCLTNESCLECQQGYSLNDNKTCSEIILYSYFGVASGLLISLLGLAIIYEAVVIVLPPKLPIIPQIMLTSIVIFSVLQTISNIIILFYTYINQNVVEFILSAISFSVTNIYYSQTCEFQNNPLIQFISQGTWIRAPLIKLKFFTKQSSQKFTNYQLIRQTHSYSHFFTNSFSIIIQISLIAIQTKNELPYLAAIKMVIDSVLLVGYILEFKFI